jgi:hypothetical protein
VKLVTLLSLSFLSQALAQSSGPNGVRIGAVQTVYMVEPGGAESLEDYVAKLSREAGGRDLELDSLNLTTDGSKLLVPPSKPTARVDFETWVEGVGKQRAESVTSGFASTKRDPGKIIIERYVRDNFRQLYIRYSLIVEMRKDSGTYRASFGSSNAPVPAGLPSNWKVFTPNQYPTPQLLRDGDQIPLYLADGAAGPSLVEYIHFGQSLPIFRKEGARDVYSEDAEFNISEPKLRVNGVGSDLRSGALHGPLLWVFVPGQGRYEISFKPRSGFVFTGESSGTSLVFVTETNLLRLDSAERIAAAGSATYRVYARRDAAWIPPDPKDSSRALLGVNP